MIVEEKLNVLFAWKNLKDHKECLKSWLKRSNECPLCKHDLTEDINKMR